MDPDEENSFHAGDSISSTTSSLTMSSNSSSQPSNLPKLPSGISITAAAQEPKSYIAHPSSKSSGNESQMPPPPISIKLTNLQKNAAEAVDNDDEGDEDGVEEVGMDDSEDVDGDDDAEDADDNDEDDEDEDDDEADDSDEDGDDSDDDDEVGDEHKTINMSSSMLGGDSETSAMSEDASFQSSFSKKSFSTPKQDPNYGSSASPSASGRSTPKGNIIDKPLGTGKKRGRPSKAVMREREEAKRARGELPEETPKEKVPKRRGRKPKIDWASMSEEVNIKQFLSNLQFLYKN